jgi:hypothetical protein
MATTVTLNDNALITTTEAEQFVFNEPDNMSDEEKDSLYRIVNGVSEAIKNHLKRNIINEEVTEYHDGGDNRILLNQFPILSIDSVYENGDELTANTAHGEDDGDYDYVEEIGEIYRVSGTFYSGRQKVKVTYTAGLGADTTEIPEDIKIACKIWVKQIFESDIENYSTIITTGSTIRPTNMPSITYKLLQPYINKRV